MCLESLVRWIFNALILMGIAYILPGVEVVSFWSALVVSVVLALVNAIIRPFLLILTLPINILTLGLFTLIINGFMFWIVSSIVKGFTITNFWSAVIAALIYSLLSIAISSFGQDSQKD